MSYKKYTEEEENFIRECHPLGYTDSHISNLMTQKFKHNFTRVGIKGKRRDLGIIKPKGNFQPHRKLTEAEKKARHQKMIDNRTLNKGRARDWSDEDNATITAMYGKHSMDDIGRAVGVAGGTVTRQLIKLGVHKPKDAYVKKEDRKKVVHVPSTIKFDVTGVRQRVDRLVQERGTYNSVQKSPRPYRPSQERCVGWID
jgi:hypothetical protein